VPYNDPQLVHWDNMLTNFSAGFDLDRDPYVADQIAPTLPVDKQSDRYYVMTRDTWGRPTDDLRAPGARANEIPPMSLTRDTYFAEEHALVGVVPIEDETNADPGLDALGSTTTELTNTILLGRENAIITMATTASNFASGFSATLAGTQQWSDYTNSNPISDAKAARNKIHGFLGTDPNTVILQWEVAAMLEDHPKIIARYQAINPKVTDEQIASVLGMERFVRAGSLGLTSGYGLAETVGYMWPKVALFAYVPPAARKRQPAFMYEFNYAFQTGLPDVNGLSAGTMPTERIFDWDRKAWKIRVARRYDLKFITVDATGKSMGGYLIAAAIA
jgi:hypothetical protein